MTTVAGWAELEPMEAEPGGSPTVCRAAAAVSAMNGSCALAPCDMRRGFGKVTIGRALTHSPRGGGSSSSNASTSAPLSTSVPETTESKVSCRPAHALVSPNPPKRSGSTAATLDDATWILMGGGVTTDAVTAAMTSIMSAGFQSSTLVIISFTTAVCVLLLVLL